MLLLLFPLLLLVVHNTDPLHLPFHTFRFPDRGEALLFVSSHKNLLSTDLLPLFLCFFHSTRHSQAHGLPLGLR